MSIRVRVPAPVAERIGFVASPALEAVLSLSVLVQPNHHPLHHEWVRRTRRELPAEMKQRVADFRFGHMDYIPAGLVPPADGEPRRFEAEMERIRALPTDEKARAILRNLIGGDPGRLAESEGSSAPDEVLDRASELGSATVALVKLGFESPADLAEGFLTFVERYWEESFAREWSEVGPKLAEVCADARSGPAGKGLFPMLETLRPRIGVNREAGEFWVRRAYEEEIVLGDDAEIQFAPSAYLWPHIGLVHDPPGRLVVLYPAPFAAFDAPPELNGTSFVPLMRALGDETRLKALKLIAERPRSTQELSRLINLSEPAMSRHLRQLADCGVLSTQRDGYYQLYRLRPERIEPLSAMLLEFLSSR